MADIEYDAFVEDNFTAIGAGFYEQEQGGIVFNGHFDGQGYTISGINGRMFSPHGYNGLFGHLGSDAEVKNIVLSNSTIGDGMSSGGIVGWNEGTVTNCHVTSTVTIKGTIQTSLMHGGIVGNNSSSVSHCTFAGILTKTFSDPTQTDFTPYCYGGIAGINNTNAIMSDNLVIGAIIPRTMFMYGAVAGGSSNDGIARNYYVKCTVAGTANATGVGCTLLNSSTLALCDITENDGAVPGNVRTVAAPYVWSSDDPENNPIDGWAFIASPVMENLVPTNVPNLIGTQTSEGYNYDLYRFNPLADEEWENYHKHTADFVLANGKGYLYAK